MGDLNDILNDMDDQIQRQQDQEGEQDQEDEQDQGEQQEQQPPELAKAKKVKGKNWSTKECVQLCTSWLEIAQDPIVGKDQKSADFWNRIFQSFERALPREAAGRNVAALQSSVRGIQADINKFAGIYDALVLSEKSGYTADKYREDALELWEAQHKNKPFKYLLCWLKVKASSKWASTMTTKRTNKSKVPTKSSTAGGSGSTTPTTPTSTAAASGSLDRPIGRKAAKAQQAAGDEAGNSQRRAAEALEKIAAETTLKRKALKDAVVNEIMAPKDTSRMSDAQKRYYEIKHRQILKKLENEQEEKDEEEE